MGFELIDRRVSAMPEPAKATVHLKKKNEWQYPILFVALKASLAQELGWKSGDPVSVWVGVGSEDGLLRLAVGSDSPAIARLHGIGAGAKNGLLADLGHLRCFGELRRLKMPIDVKRGAGPNEIIITLPGGESWRSEWTPYLPLSAKKKMESAPEKQVRTEDNALPSISSARRGLNDAAKKVDPPRPASADVLKPVGKGSVTLAQRFGMRVNSGPYEVVNAAVNGGKYHCTDVQAGIVAALLAVSPSILLPNDIAKRAYGLVARKLSSGSPGLVDYEIRVLQPRLVDIGIKITHTKGMGYSLAAIDAA